ncbi:MAG: 2-C-methyl-D-erythritol 4-phosphate cytidylyltransferase [Bacteroidales bacterium]
MKKYVIIVAGGKGLRMGSELPKQFIPINGLPVLMHTIDKFKDSIEDIEIILVIPQSHEDYWRELTIKHKFNTKHKIVYGGETRFHSVKNGLSACEKNNSIVAVHDGVRPLVTKEVIIELFKKAQEVEAVIPIIPVHETVRHLLSDGASITVPREDYALVQTPQLFRSELIKEAYLQPFDPHFTDDASVVESIGGKVTLIQGNRENIKLTTPLDLKLASILISEYSIQA